MGFEAEEPSKDALRLLIWKEVQRFHPHLDGGGGGGSGASR